MSTVDVAIPCYNYGRYLERCVESVLDQGLSDVRVMIIDDASTDDLLKVAKKLSRSDSRVDVISHSDNLGHIETYNEGIAWASSDYFVLLSADDLLVPGSLERAVAIMDSNPDIGLTYGKFVYWHDHLPVPEVGREDQYTWARQNFIFDSCASGFNLVCSPTVVTRTASQKAIGGYNRSLPHTADMAMWLRFAAEVSVAMIDAVQAIYRIHSSNMHSPYAKEILSDYQERKRAFDDFFEEYRDTRAGAEAMRGKVHRVLARQAYWSGVARLCKGRVQSGLALLEFAFDLDPRLKYCPPLVQLFMTPSLGKRIGSTFEEAVSGLISRV